MSGGVEPMPPVFPQGTQDARSAPVDATPNESRLFGVSVPGWATLMLVGTVCGISMCDAIAAAVMLNRGQPVSLKIPDATYQLATVALGFYLGRKSAGTKR